MAGPLFEFDWICWAFKILALSRFLQVGCDQPLGALVSGCKSFPFMVRLCPWWSRNELPCKLEIPTLGYFSTMVTMLVHLAATILFPVSKITHCESA